MILLKRYMEIAIGLAVFALIMATNALPYAWHRRLEALRLLQFTATLVQLFGVLKAHREHKHRLEIFWLVVTAISLIGLLYAGLMELAEFDSVLGCALAWAIAVLVAPLFNIMYSQYVATNIEIVENLTEIIQTQQMPEAQKRQPLDPVLTNVA